MSNPPGFKSRDGFQWTRETGLQAGVPSLGVIRPTAKLPSRAQEHIHDVAVVGAGYTGLTAIRDLATTGHDVLLLEARDRIGGRSWSSNIHGYAYELGGTWVHWCQPFVWRELSRYGLAPKIEVSPVVEGGVNKFILTMGNRKIEMTHEQEAEMTERIMKKFVNVDGNFGRTVIPLPHDPTTNIALAAHYDTMSLGDRLDQIRDEITEIERNSFEAFLSITCGGQWHDSSFFEFLRWWALMNYNFTDFMALGLTYKFGCGQSAFARCMFDEALETKRLHYSFSTPVRSVADRGSHVEITSRSGEVFRARRLICTLPLNVLGDVSFSPPLSRLKREASQLGHSNQVVKVHAEVANPELRSLSASAYPVGKLTFCFGDGTTPAGNTHLVAFGSSLPGQHLQPEENMEETLAAWRNFTDMDVRRVVFHNWHKDEFAKGAWEWLKPGMATKYVSALRERQGNVLFASSDWALGWRAFIDGGIEDGGKAAKEVADELKTLKGSEVKAQL